MRIAVSGTHRTGKTTLCAELGDQLRGYEVVPEPYDVLSECGYDFVDPPEVDDFVVQLRHSLLSMQRRSPNLIFDRCPLDFVGYIEASRGGERFNVETWRDPIARAMASLDLVVSLPADPRFDPPVDAEEAPYRLAVDAALREIVDGDVYGLCGDTEILVLDGRWERRVETVMAAIRTPHSARPGAPPSGHRFCSR